MPEIQIDEKKSLINSSTTEYQENGNINKNKKLKNITDYDYNSSSDEEQYYDVIVTAAEVHSSPIAEKPIIVSDGMNNYFNEWAQNNNGFNSDLINIESQPSILRNQTEVENVTSEYATRLNINPRKTFGHFLVNENNNWSDNDFSFNENDDESQNFRLNLATDNASLNNLFEESNWSNSHSLIVNMINESNGNNCENRYGGISQKNKVDGNWEYKTEIRNNKGNLEIQINEEFVKINTKFFWIKRIHNLNTNKIILELLYFDKNNKLRPVYKLYNNKNSYLIDLPKLNVSYIEETFTPVKQSTWSKNFLHDSKKVLQGLGYLLAVIGIRTIQRAFTVMVSDEDEEIDWERLLKTINPIESPIEYGLTLPQSLISVLAIDVWKWGLTNIRKEIKKLTTILGIRTTDASYTEININDNQTISNNGKGILKFFGAKLGYWVPNHFMTTCSSMYTHESLTSVLAYWRKIKSGWNITSSLIRAEVLRYISDFLKDGFAKFGEMYLFTSIKPHIINLFEKLENLQSYNCHQEASKTCEIIMSSLKIIAYLSIMTGATVIDNANKTAVFMWTADKLDKFESIFFTWEMAAIMIGLICVDTFGNKYCKVKADEEFNKLRNAWKGQPQLEVNTNQANINDDIETPVDPITSDNLNEKEKELIQKFASEEASSTTYQQLLQRYDWNSFALEVTENQAQAFDRNWIRETSFPPLPTSELTNSLIRN